MAARKVCRFLSTSALVAVALLPSPARATPAPGSLLSRYQPVTVSHPAELFAPVAVDPFLQTAQLEQRMPDGTWIPAIGQTPGVLPTTDPEGCTSTTGSACW